MKFHVSRVFDAAIGKARWSGRTFLHRIRFFPLSISAFTLIELMLVVAIIGLLAAIALPKFADLVRKAREASLRGKVGTLRSAISIYYVDNLDFYPRTLGGLTLGGKYLDSIPTALIPAGTHTTNNAVWSGSAAPDDSGNTWFYYTGTQNVCAVDADCFPFGEVCLSGVCVLRTPPGLVKVNCSHTDSKGSTWSAW